MPLPEKKCDFGRPEAAMVWVTWRSWATFSRMVEMRRGRMISIWSEKGEGGLVGDMGVIGGRGGRTRGPRFSSLGKVYICRGQYLLLFCAVCCHLQNSHAPPDLASASSPSWSQSQNYSARKSHCLFPSASSPPPFYPPEELTQNKAQTHKETPPKYSPPPPSTPPSPS